jgi:hypothetical protein
MVVRLSAAAGRLPLLTLYDTIGKGYAAQRKSDPRIAAVLHRALSGADSLVNVGAGTGSYEPDDRSVVAIAPSLTMIRQRPPGAAPAIQAMAERLPLRDGWLLPPRCCSTALTASRGKDVLDTGYRRVVADRSGA